MLLGSLMMDAVVRGRGQDYFYFFHWVFNQRNKKYACSWITFKMWYFKNPIWKKNQSTTDVHPYGRWSLASVPDKVAHEPSAGNREDSKPSKRTAEAWSSVVAKLLSSPELLSHNSVRGHLLSQQSAWDLHLHSANEWAYSTRTSCHC